MVQAARTAAPSWFEFRKRGGRSDENSCFSGTRERKRQPLRLVLVLRQMAHPRPWGGPPRGALRRPEKPIRRNWICTKDRRPAAGRLGAGFKQAAEAIGLLCQANHGREEGEKKMKAPRFGKISIDQEARQAIEKASRACYAVCGNRGTISVRQVSPTRPRLFCLPSGIALFIPLCRECAGLDQIDTGSKPQLGRLQNHAGRHWARPALAPPYRQKA